MTQRRYELTDFEWSIIEPLLPNKPRGVPRVDDRRVLSGIYWRLRIALGRHPRALWALHDLLQPLCSMGEAGCVGQNIRRGISGLRRVRAIRGQFFDPGSPTRRERKKGGEAPADAAGLADLRAVCMGRSRGGLTTKIHAACRSP